jgi:mannose-6-phosphate isomerase
MVAMLCKHEPATESDIGIPGRQLDVGSRASGHNEAVAEGETEIKPWGSFTVLDDAAGHKVKRMVVRPGKRLSYQRHARRSEHWFVVQGQARVVVDGCPSALTVGMALDIPVTAAHRIENDGTEDLVFIEVQRGDYFGEDDIVRLEDDFGRAPAGG